MHVGKTEFIVFGSGKRLKKAGNVTVNCNGSPVKRVSVVKYLGVLLGEALTGKEQAESVIKTCAGRLSFLYRKAAFLNFECRKMLASSLIQPHIDYCASSWYEGLTKQLKRKLDVLQRRMLRFVFLKGPRDHVGINELKSLSWLSVPQRVKYFSLVHVFKICLGLAPNYLSPLFVPNEMVHSHGTRGLICNYHVSRNLAKAPTSFAFMAIKHWNSLPISFKSNGSLNQFKIKLKSFLINEN